MVRARKGVAILVDVGRKIERAACFFEKFWQKRAFYASPSSPIHSSERCRSENWKGYYAFFLIKLPKGPKILRGPTRLTSNNWKKKGNFAKWRYTRYTHYTFAYLGRDMWWDEFVGWWREMNQAYISFPRVLHYCFTKPGERIKVIDGWVCAVRHDDSITGVFISIAYIFT
jgi:hypothetical protein